MKRSDLMSILFSSCFLTHFTSFSISINRTVYTYFIATATSTIVVTSTGTYFAIDEMDMMIKITRTRSSANSSTRIYTMVNFFKTFCTNDCAIFIMYKSSRNFHTHRAFSIATFTWRRSTSSRTKATASIVCHSSSRFSFRSSSRKRKMQERKKKSSPWHS